MFEDSNSVANRLEKMVKQKIDFKKLADLYDEDRETAEKTVNGVLNEVYTEFVNTLSNKNDEEIKLLLSFYNDEKLPNLKRTADAINNKLVIADYYLNNTIFKYILNKQNIKTINNDEVKAFNLKQTEKNLKILNKIEKLKEKNPRKARQLFEKFIKEQQSELEM